MYDRWVAGGAREFLKKETVDFSDMGREGRGLAWVGLGLGLA